MNNIKLTKHEEDYLKSLYKLVETSDENEAGTNSLAQSMGISPGSVSLMLKKLKSKELVDYKKYGKLKLSDKGRRIAVQLIRRHRLWETFLYDKLNFTWDEVHEIAEQLEHIDSKKLIDRLEEYLGYPEQDPHGDIIPSASGEIKPSGSKTLDNYDAGSKCKVVSVNDNSVEFLKYLDKVGLELGTELKVLEKHDFDESLLIAYDGQQLNISSKFAGNVFVEEAG